VTAYLSVEQIVALHSALIEQFGGSKGLRDSGGLDAAAARPAATFGGEDLYPDLPSKAAALMHSLVMNHPFIDGNKRVGAAAAELLLHWNGWDVIASDADYEGITLRTAEGGLDAEALAIWFRQRSRQRPF
jgi:death-on-curing protein